MSLSEILLTAMVAFIVFGPKKLPMLAQHLGLLIKHIRRHQQKASLLWQDFLLQQQLKENNQKANEADIHYQQNKNDLLE